MYEFRVLSADGATVFAEGGRVVIKLDRAAFRPATWTPDARAVAVGILRNTPRPDC